MEHKIKVEHKGKILNGNTSLCGYLCKFFELEEYIQMFPPGKQLKMRDKRALEHHLTLYLHTLDASSLGDYVGAKIKIKSIKTFHPKSAGRIAKRKIHLKVITK